MTKEEILTELKKLHPNSINIYSIGDKKGMIIDKSAISKEVFKELDSLDSITLNWILTQFQKP